MSDTYSNLEEIITLSTIDGFILASLTGAFLMSKYVPRARFFKHLIYQLYVFLYHCAKKRTANKTERKIAHKYTRHG